MPHFLPDDLIGFHHGFVIRYAQVIDDIIIPRDGHKFQLFSVFFLLDQRQKAAGMLEHIVQNRNAVPGAFGMPHAGCAGAAGVYQAVVYLLFAEHGFFRIYIEPLCQIKIIGIAVFRKANVMLFQHTAAV